MTDAAASILPGDAAPADEAAWVWNALCSAMRPEQALMVAEWADKHRILPPTVAEPGPWRTSRVPYMREPMNCLSTGSPWKRIILMKGAQVAATECGNNWLGYVIQHAPGMALCVLPSLDDVKKNVTTRIDPLIDSSPSLSALVAKPRGRRAANSMFRKEFPGGFLVFTGATSPKGLRSTPARYLYLDEVDGYPIEAGKDGDPVDLAVQRTVTFKGRSKVYMCSTPTLKGQSRIEKAFEEGDQRVYEVPCNGCGEFSRIVWANIAWPKASGELPYTADGVVVWPEPAKVDRDRRDLAFWWCPNCGRIHQDYEKRDLLAAGRWRATAEGDGFTASFHISALYSPFESWGDIAMQHKAAGNDPARLQPWVNNKLGEVFEDQSGEKIEPATIMERAETADWTKELPPGVALLTAAVDTQDDRLEVEVVGWGKDEESWSILHQKLYGDTSDRTVWQELDDLLLQTFSHALSVPDLPIAACCIDTQGHSSAMAYTFVRDKQARRVWGIKGSNITGKPPIWPKKPSHKNKGRIPLYFVGVSTAKEVIYSRLKRVTEPGAGFMHFPADRPDTYFAQLTAERVSTVYVKGRATQVWDAGGRRNEALDLKVYNLAALKGLEALGFDLNAAAARVAMAPPRVSGMPTMSVPPPAARTKPMRSRYIHG